MKKQTKVRCAECHQPILGTSNWHVLRKGKKLEEVCGECFMKMIAQRRKETDV